MYHLNIRNLITSCLVIVMSLQLCRGVSIRTFKYEKSSTSPLRGGASCVISRNGESRGLRHRRETGECLRLDDTWFDEPMYESGYSYLSQKVVTHLFDSSSLSIVSDIPPNVIVGSTIDVYVTSQSDRNLHKFKLDITDLTKKKTYFHMNLRPNDSKKVVFNHFVNYWGHEEIETSNPFIGCNTTFKITLRINANAIKVKVNDAVLHTFRHRMSVSLYRLLRYRGHREPCQRIVYTAP